MGENMAHGDIIKDADLGKDAHIPALGEQEDLPGGAVTVSDAVPEMPPGSDMNDVARPGGGLTADDTAQPTSTADPTGDRATGLTALRD